MTRQVLSGGARLTAAGLAVGLAAAFTAAPMLRDLPIAVRPPDGVTAAPTALLIASVALLACLLPARRAAAVDPMAVLRRE